MTNEVKEKIKLAVCVFGHGGSYQTWVSGTEQNIVLAKINTFYPIFRESDILTHQLF